MSSSLEDLFSQILHSEQIAHERRSLINQVKSDIARTHEKIKEVQEKMISVKGKLVLKLPQWNDVQLQLTSSSLKENILRAQKEELLQTQYRVHKQLADVSLKIDNAGQAFCTSAQEFTSCYDLCSNGTHQRELQVKNELQRLCLEETHLTTGLRSYQERQTELVALKTERDKYLAQLRETTTKFTDAQKQAAAEETLCSELEREKIRLAELPYKDLEFKSLQADWEASQSTDLEMLCSTLQRQRQELQQRLWQQELGRKRKQQHRDQSNYQQCQRLGQAEEQEVTSLMTPSNRDSRKRQTRPNIARLSQAVSASKKRMPSNDRVPSQS